MKKNMLTIDGNEAAAYVAYAFTEVATIYPITPSSPMADHVDVWAGQGRKNIFDQTVRLVEMQSEHGAAGAMHGALETGALSSTYTSSQGLLLMVPAMYRMAGQLLPGVMHVSARSLATHAISIFGDHSDVMACRQTGFAILASANVQEVMDLAAAAHLAAIDGRVPFLHFFDGFRTSHEVQKIEALAYDDLAALLNRKALESFRQNALTPEAPVQRTTAQNPDVHFQHREAVNPFYERLPGLTQAYLNKLAKLTGRQYGLFDYYGAPDAAEVVVAMGSVCETLKETVDHLAAKGDKVGLLQVRLYRPFAEDFFLKTLPDSARTITVLDRCKEPGSAGEPLFKDVQSALAGAGRRAKVLGGRYGLSSKDVSPAQMLAVFENMKNPAPKKVFTVGINDDLTHLSLPLEPVVDTGSPKTKSCKFWALGSDGTVGANKNSVKIIGDHTDFQVQAYFEYDAKKSGGVTKSHLRYGPDPIRSPYLVAKADLVACHNASYIFKYDMLDELKDGGVFLLNCPWPESGLAQHLPGKVKRQLAEKNIRFYIVDATKIALELGLGNRINTVLQAAFFKLADILPAAKVMGLMKAAISESYGAKGEKVLAMNMAAVDQGFERLSEVAVPQDWKNAADDSPKVDESAPDFVKNIMHPVNAMRGDQVPVSAFAALADGTVPTGTSKYEKRGVAAQVPKWQSENCLQCNLCAFVCPHAAVRPYLLTDDEAAGAPTGYQTIGAHGGQLSQYRFRIQVSPLDCTGCGSCAQVCPAKNKALVMAGADSQTGENVNWSFSQTLTVKANSLDKFTVKGSQLETPLLEFSGACGGCGETPYMKLLTQLFGDKMYLANAVGCAQAWGAAFPCAPYTVNSQGRGPALSNSLFENNAEFGLGMVLADRQHRDRLAHAAENFLMKDHLDQDLKTALHTWLAAYNNGEEGRTEAQNLLAALKTNGEHDEARQILAAKNYLTKKSVWVFGGDGWAYDIGFGGLDHVLATPEDINMLVVDTEVYSNTGGQASKATPLGAVAPFASKGKRTPKKDLGLMMMGYGHIYVAQVAMGADNRQLITALKEAESYQGPSLVIAYAPCINHGLVKGMAHVQAEIKRAVACGYWPLFRFDPRRAETGANPFILDSKEPTLKLRDFLEGEVRFAALMRKSPQEAEELVQKAQSDITVRYDRYRRLAAQ